MRAPISHNSHIIRYGVIATFFIRILLLGYLYYEYLVSKNDKAPTKGGTLIEGVTSNVSYVPYTSNSPQDSFYQRLLFKGCQSYFSSGSQVIYEEELCSVISNDNKTFVVSIIGTGTWSDGAPISIQDLLFTYEDIFQKNIWGLSHGKSYEGLSIQKISNNSLSITFPRSSKDNMQFFTAPILPSHIVGAKDWKTYKELFTASPTTNGCAKLSNSRDEKSLIFDVGACKETWLKYYQVKNISRDDIKEDPGIIDMYIGNKIVPGYKTGTVVSNDYVGIFFNMQRGKLSIYGRKNVIALVNKYIYAPENGVPIIKEHFLFDGYPTAISDKSTISLAASGSNNRIHVLYYAQDQVHNHIAETMKNIMTQEGLADNFYFEGVNGADEYLAKLSTKEYDITIQTLALGFKKDISALFLINNSINNPSLYINANLANQINDYFQSPLSTQYSIKPIITKLYTTDLPFFIVGKRIGYVNLKPTLALPQQVRRDDASVRLKIFHDIVAVYKPQITRKDLIDRRRFSSFILSELGL